MASGSGTKNLDFCQKWDKDEYEKLAEKQFTEEREKKDGKLAQPVKRDLLRHRDYNVDLESKLGKTIIITKTTPPSEMGGYYCNICDCVVKDSINFLDHINAKKHQRNLGMWNMQVEHSTLDQVKKCFEVNKKKMEEKQKGYDFEKRVKKVREKEEKAKAYKKEKQREKKRQAEEDLTFEVDDEKAAVMGFSGFGSTQNNH